MPQNFAEYGVAEWLPQRSQVVAMRSTHDACSAMPVAGPAAPMLGCRGGRVAGRTVYAGDAGAVLQPSPVSPPLAPARRSDSTQATATSTTNRTVSSANRARYHQPARATAARREGVGSGMPETGAALPANTRVAAPHRCPPQQSGTAPPSRSRPLHSSRRCSGAGLASGRELPPSGTSTRRPSGTSTRSSNTAAEHGTAVPCASATHRVVEVSAAQMAADEEMLIMEALACSLEEEEGNDEQLMRHLLRMEGGQPEASTTRAPVQKGVDKLLLSMLPITEWHGASTDCSDECPLCICEYEVGERLLRLPCLHSAHEECLSQWLDRNAQCPVCKLDVQESLAAMCD